MPTPPCAEMFVVCFIFLKTKSSKSNFRRSLKKNITLYSGSLGSGVDEERSELRVGM